MEREAVERIWEDVLEHTTWGVQDFGIVGADPAGLAFVERVGRNLPSCTIRWYGESALALAAGHSYPLAQLASDKPSVIIVAEDARKEAVLLEARRHIDEYRPVVLLAGYAHYGFHDELFELTLADLHVPSIANGYPNTLVHLYECVTNAARLGLDGAIVEFGVFKGGTTMFLARVAHALGQRWRVIGFDTFGGFPPRRSSFDMYSHPGAVFRDFEAVERYLGSEGIELIRGDIVETASRLGETPVVVGFIDTDNYSSARAAIGALRENVVVGGAIIFDHLTGVARFRYTLGERMAAREMLADDDRYFNLHGTGVFLRMK
jgi:O-methyltransferase